VSIIVYTGDRPLVSKPRFQILADYEAPFLPRIRVRMGLRVIISGGVGVRVQVSPPGNEPTKHRPYPIADLSLSTNVISNVRPVEVILSDKFILHNAERAVLEDSEQNRPI